MFRRCYNVRFKRFVLSFYNEARSATIRECGEFQQLSKGILMAYDKLFFLVKYKEHRPETRKVCSIHLYCYN